MVDSSNQTVDSCDRLTGLQELIAQMYGGRDEERGPEATFLWFMEEVGELAAEIRTGNKQALESEFADVLAWLATLANITNVDLAKVVQNKYGFGCPGCKTSPCACDESEKP